MMRRECMGGAKGIAYGGEAALWLLAAVLASGCAGMRAERPAFGGGDLDGPVALAPAPPGALQETPRETPPPAGPQPEGAAPPAPPPAGASAPFAQSFSLRSGIGFTLDPDTFLLTLEGDAEIAENVLVGPLVQLGIADHWTIVAPTLNFQYVFDLSGLEGFEGFEAFHPFVQGGPGLAYVHRDRRRGDDDDVGFLFNLGFGFEYEVSERFAIGNNLLFNILPAEVNDEHFFFSWQFVTFKVTW